MLSLSKDANVNYLAKVVKIKELKPHPNADRLQVTIIDFQELIVGMDTKVGDIAVFFPLESEINSEFLSYTNSYRHSNLNRVVDDEKCGFFDDNGRVRAVRLRGQKSMGVLFPASLIMEWNGTKDYDYEKLIGKEFDMIGDKRMLKKYFIPIKDSLGRKALGRKPRVSRLVENQVRLHVDTENLLKNIDKISSGTDISITYKVHGTSFWVSNVLVKKKLSVIEKFLKRLGVNVQETEYDYVYGSRKVVKNEYETSHKEHYYEYDLWGLIKDELKDSIPAGYTLYGECVGYTKGGGYIQKPYDYGCKPGEHKLMIYRITITNKDGQVFNLSTLDAKSFCDRNNLTFVPVFFTGFAGEIDDIESWDSREFVEYLKDNYTEKDCYLCNKKVPEEGIVLRVESQFCFEAYKLKSFAFLEQETKMLDSGEENMEG